MKIFRKIVNILSYALIGIEILLIIIIVINRFSDGTTSLFGYRLYVVATPSMSPEINVGDVVLSKNYKDDMTLEVGDVITYIGSTGNYDGRSITHKIVSIDNEHIVTKGIANSEADPPINYNQIESKVIYKTIIITIITKIITSPFGFFLLIFIPLLVWINIEIYKFIFEIKKKRKEN